MRLAAATFCIFLMGPVQAEAGWWEDNTCPRAIPVPALKPGQTAHTFTIESDRGVAIETALIDGAPVTITHSGCEMVTWVIQIPAPGGAKPTPAEGWAVAGETLKRIKGHEEFLFGLDLAIALIDSGKGPLPGFGEFTYLHGDEQSGLAFGLALTGSPAKGDDAAMPYTLEISFSDGPL